VQKDAFVSKMTPDADATKMRERASRLLSLATRSRCEGRPDYAALLTNLATEILEHARDLEQREDDIGPSSGYRKAGLRPHTV
jgi:hypothetical protein